MTGIDGAQKDLDALKARGEQVVERINGKLRELLSQDLVELDAIRDLLMKFGGFGDGQNIERGLRQALLTPRGWSQEEEALRLTGSCRRATLQIALVNMWPPGTRR